jgi:hypothetical protein
MNLLVIGANDTGKTHFIGQLFARLRQGEASLQLRASPSNLAALEEILERLNEGRTADHTPSDTYYEIDLPLITTKNKEFNLLFPDYDGEQVKNIVENRLITAEWINRLKQSHAWLFFIRLSLVHAPDDIQTRPPGNSIAKTVLAKTMEWTTENSITSATFVELLQALLAVTQKGFVKKRKDPVLVIILSCWDELKGSEATELAKPMDVLRQKIPMFSEFVTANWEEDKLLVYGLSSLGKSLDPDIPDEEYLDKGPENFGYVVTSDGQHEKDLTHPLTKVLDLIENGD